MSDHKTRFALDPHISAEGSGNEELWRQRGRDFAARALAGELVTIVCTGPPGGGKSFSLNGRGPTRAYLHGEDSKVSKKVDPNVEGLVGHAFADLLALKDAKTRIYVSLVSPTEKGMRDLLSERQSEHHRPEERSKEDV